MDEMGYVAPGPRQEDIEMQFMHRVTFASNMCKKLGITVIKFKKAFASSNRSLIFQMFTGIRFQKLECYTYDWNQRKRIDQRIHRIYTQKLRI